MASTESRRLSCGKLTSLGLGLGLGLGFGFGFRFRVWRVGVAVGVGVEGVDLVARATAPYDGIRNRPRVGGVVGQAPVHEAEVEEHQPT